MSWLQNVNVNLLDAGDLDSHVAQLESGILSASDGIQRCQPVRDCLPLVRVPPGGSTP